MEKNNNANSVYFQQSQELSALHLKRSKREDSLRQRLGEKEFRAFKSRKQREIEIAKQKLNNTRSLNNITSQTGMQSNIVGFDHTNPISSKYLDHSHKNDNFISNHHHHSHSGNEKSLFCGIL